MIDVMFDNLNEDMGNIMVVWLVIAVEMTFEYWIHCSFGGTLDGFRAKFRKWENTEEISEPARDD